MARLPTVGGDDGNWGTVLNEFLQVDHENDGTHKSTAITTHALPKDAAILSKSGNYTLATGDEGKIIECNGTFTLTLPNSLDTGFQVTVVNVGSGVITFSASTTLQSKDSATQLANQYGMATAYHRGSNVWLIAGDLS